jgi:hypothetical protein
MKPVLTKLEREIVREFAGGRSIFNLTVEYWLDRLDVESVIRKAMRAQNRTAMRPFWYRQQKGGRR